MARGFGYGFKKLLIQNLIVNPGLTINLREFVYSPSVGLDQDFGGYAQAEGDRFRVGCLDGDGIGKGIEIDDISVDARFEAMAFGEPQKAPALVNDPTDTDALPGFAVAEWDHAGHDDFAAGGRNGIAVWIDGRIPEEFVNFFEDPG
jgi:hypothetical protein